MRRWLVPVTLVALAGIASPPAAASSIVYVKGGDIWRYRLRRAQARDRPSARDHRVQRRDPGRPRAPVGGARAGAPLGALHGAGAASASRSTRLGPASGCTTIPSATCPGSPARSTRRSPTTAGCWRAGAFSSSSTTSIPSRSRSRLKYFVAQFNSPNVGDCCHDADITAGLPTNDLAWPSWLHDGTFIAAPFSNLLKGYGIWYVPARIPELRFWFGPSNSAFRLAHPEVTRRGDHIAATIDTHNALSKDEEITVGHLPGPPPAVPDRDCTWPNPHGTVADLTWSPDGARWPGRRRRRLDRALRGARATGQLCSVTARRLLARATSRSGAAA